MEKSNQERLEKYLVGNDGYLKNDISNGKVIMLSGKWGSGKTFFWKNKIQTVLNDDDKKIPNHYISLYGKTSIEEIKNEVFLKIFQSVDSSNLEEKGTTLLKNTVDLISLFVKSVGIDLSKFTDNSFKHIEKFLKDKKLKKTVEYLNSGAIICFDDFERKSKDIDLNDLFGFITQLTLNFDCKVVIILNDDVFEGEEKNVFSRVKEKSVSKFLKYEPSIKELFKTIFYERRKDNKKSFKYLKLRKYKQIILKTIEKTQELNARIYIQVLDNLVEWIEKNQDKSDDVLRCLILVNINFILNHKIVISDIFEEYVYGTPKKIELQKYKIKRFTIKGLENEHKYERLFSKIVNSKYTKQFLIDNLIDDELKIIDESSKINIDSNTKFINENHLNIYAIHFASILNFDENILKSELNIINNFIESGILINE